MNVMDSKKLVEIENALFLHWPLNQTGHLRMPAEATAFVVPELRKSFPCQCFIHWEAHSNRSPGESQDWMLTSALRLAFCSLGSASCSVKFRTFNSDALHGERIGKVSHVFESPNIEVFGMFVLAFAIHESSQCHLKL